MNVGLNIKLPVKYNTLLLLITLVFFNAQAKSLHEHINPLPSIHALNKPLFIQQGEDILPFGFRFDMNKQAVLARMLVLQKEKKLVTNKALNRDGYVMPFGLIKVLASPAPQFDNDRISTFTLVLSPLDDMATPKTVYYQAVEAYLKKYKDFKIAITPDSVNTDLKKYRFTQGNLDIYVRKAADVTLVTYKDLAAAANVKK